LTIKAAADADPVFAADIDPIFSATTGGWAATASCSAVITTGTS
jgi:hypothetical protein